jgi:hypothetical protein
VANFLEQLTREWYEYQGYFVRQNINVGKRSSGGYECELDIVAFHPKKQHLVHVEPSMDADSWANREKRYSKKFAAGRKHIPHLFEGLDVPDSIEQIALLVFASTTNRKTLGGGRIMILDQFLSEILTGLAESTIASSAVPEQLPIVRTLQFVSHYRLAVVEAWGKSTK